ncbi:hypothetical protein [Candidatus Kuenenia stuttgartiensis]|uniref:Uncharacterized protein n=1 Tax=Kuenenia stuttgartiensis TaxID=174633 RepID=Q1Q584_KUEST|nr:hypothetical protein [Candidatus Kuenenia stuttgartiensis]CAJ75177.1 unknown protein [Candidatus Kuenenia stuttgartiensis]
MELIALVLSSLSVIGLVIAGLLLRGYLPSYVAEKGKNLASKEDLAHLTGLVESVKALHISELERLKADLLAESQTTERRRRVYEEMCFVLRVFISGHGGTPEIKELFHATYAAAWLWATDNVLVSLNHFIALQVQRAADPASVDQPTMKGAYTAIVIEMRKDVGFGGTVASGSDYQFVQF